MQGLKYLMEDGVISIISNGEQCLFSIPVSIFLMLASALFFNFSLALVQPIHLLIFDGQSIKRVFRAMANIYGGAFLRTLLPPRSR